MKINTKEAIFNNLRKHSLNLLIIWTAEIENQLIDLKKQGEKGDTSKNRYFDELRQKRTAYRLILLEKLEEWRKDPAKFNNQETERINFSNIQEWNNKLKDEDIFKSYSNESHNKHKVT